MAQWHEGEGHYCGCVMCTGGPLRARESLKMVHFDGRTVSGAPGAIFIYGAITNTL